MNFWATRHGYGSVFGAAASSQRASSSILSTQANPLAQTFKMPNGSTMSLKTAEASYHPAAQPGDAGPIYPDAQWQQPATADSPGVLEQLGQWVWVLPAGAVAVALGVYFYKHRSGSLQGYRRRSRR